MSNEDINSEEVSSHIPNFLNPSTDSIVLATRMGRKKTRRTFEFRRLDPRSGPLSISGTYLFVQSSRSVFIIGLKSSLRHLLGAIGWSRSAARSKHSELFQTKKLRIFYLQLRAALENAQRTDSRMPDRQDSKHSSDSSSDHMVPGTALGATLITPADVVRKISSQMPPPFHAGRPVASQVAPPSTIYESTHSSRDRFVSQSTTDQQRKSLEEQIDIALFQNGPKEYFYTNPPEVVSSDQNEKR